METPEMTARMWADLLTAEIDARNAQHRVTSRAEIYLACGLELDKVLDALKISRATWYRRLDAFHAWQTENQAKAAAADASRAARARDDAARLD